MQCNWETTIPNMVEMMMRMMKKLDDNHTVGIWWWFYKYVYDKQTYNYQHKDGEDVVQNADVQGFSKDSKRNHSYIYAGFFYNPVHAGTGDGWQCKGKKQHSIVVRYSCQNSPSVPWHSVYKSLELLSKDDDSGSVTCLSKIANRYLFLVSRWLP